MEARRVLPHCRDQASSSQDPTSHILQQAVGNQSQAVAGAIPSVSAMQRMIQRQRAGAQNVPPNPQTSEEFVIPEQYRTIKIFEKEEDFLHYDATEEGRRIVIFTTRKNLEILTASKIIKSDGTFKIAPLFLTQLYTLHGSFHGKFVPLVFVLLSHKDKQSYSAMLAKIRELCPGMEPGVIITDIERGAINAYKKYFANSQQKCCFFHLAQNYQKKLGEDGLKRRYENDADFALAIRMVPCLVFLPPGQVEAGFEAIEDFFEEDEDAAKIQAVLAYFEDTYIGKLLTDFFSF